MTLLDPATLRLPPRSLDSHKGDYGRVLIVAGSVRMPGAALLATLGALRGGAGLVTLATPREVVPWIVGAAPAAMFRPLVADASGSLDASALGDLEDAVSTSDVVAIGPGLGQDPPTQDLIRRLVAAAAKPLVLDADGLNAFAAAPSDLASRTAPTVLTPHPGEFARLDPSSSPVPKDDASRIDRAEALARRLHAVVVLKGHRSVVTDGADTYVNDTGNPGMATGGSGDVLAGVIAALLAVLPPLRAAALGVRVHGLAGDLAAADGCETSLLATDLIAALPRAFRSHESPRR